MVPVRSTQVASGAVSSGARGMEDVPTRIQSLTASLNHWGSRVEGETFTTFQKLRARSEASVGAGLSAMIGLCVLVLMIACLLQPWSSDQDETKESDPTLSAVEYGNSLDSDWARAYRESRDKRREAIELLFKCNIITMPEFTTNAAVKQQHRDIEACVKVGLSMLQECSPAEWEARWQEAHETFKKQLSGGTDQEADLMQNSARESGHYYVPYTPAQSAPLTYAPAQSGPLTYAPAQSGPLSS